MRALPRPFLAWLALFYAAWLLLVPFGGRWGAAAAHWPVAASMALGSFVAGATPMGGGSVGFPVLVLVFGQAPSLGRDFSFAIQSIGMTSASILLLSGRAPLAWRALAAAIAGATVGTPLGLLLLVDHLSPLAIKVLFATLLAAFGLMHVRRAEELVTFHGVRPHGGVIEPALAGAAGFVGGATVAASTGVGTDVLLYMVLVLVGRWDLRVAIPTSVVLMAATSLVGVATQVATGRFDAGVVGPWMAAAPVVAVGAPLGAVVVARVGRLLALRFVSVLCLLQLVWTCVATWEDLGGVGLVAVVAGVLALWGVFEAMYAWGGRLGVSGG